MAAQARQVKSSLEFSYRLRRVDNSFGLDPSTGMEWNCKIHNCMATLEWRPQSKWAADTYSILPYEYQERISCEYKERYVYLIAGATMYDFPVIT